MTATNKIVNGVRISLTSKEAAAIEAEWIARASEADARRALDYRSKRKNAYVEELGKDPDLFNTIGDVLDALIKAHYGDAADLDAIKAKIDDIKTRFPQS